MHFSDGQRNFLFIGVIIYFIDIFYFKIRYFSSIISWSRRETSTCTITAPFSLRTKWRLSYFFFQSSLSALNLYFIHNSIKACVLHDVEEDDESKNQRKRTQVCIVINNSFYPFSCFYWNNFWKHTSMLFWFMFSLVIVLVISCDPICQWIILDLFRFQIGITNSLIRVRCCMSYIHYAYHSSPTWSLCP